MDKLFVNGKELGPNDYRIAYTHTVKRIPYPLWKRFLMWILPARYAHLPRVTVTSSPYVVLNEAPKDGEQVVFTYETKGWDDD